MPARLARSAALAAAGLLLGPTPAARAQAWDNPFGGDWNNVWNWQSPPGVPAGGNAQTLGFVVPDVLSYTANNNIPGTLTLNALNFSNPSGMAGSGTVTIGGNPITFDAATGPAFITNNGSGTVTITNNLGFANPNQQLVFNGTGAGTVRLAGSLGQLTGSPTNSVVFNTDPLATTSLENSNLNYQGTFTLASGVVRLIQPGGLGVNTSNTLTIAGPNTLIDLAFVGQGTLHGDVVLSGGDLNLAGAPQLNFIGGQVSGPGGLVIHSGFIQPAVPGNSFTGDVRVFGGQLGVGTTLGVLGSGTGPVQLGRPYGSGGIGSSAGSFPAAQLYLDSGATASGVVTLAGSVSGSELRFTSSATTFTRPRSRSTSTAGRSRPPGTARPPRTRRSARSTSAGPGRSRSTPAAPGRRSSSPRSTGYRAAGRCGSAGRASATPRTCSSPAGWPPPAGPAPPARPPSRSSPTRSAGRAAPTSAPASSPSSPAPSRPRGSGRCR